MKIDFHYLVAWRHHSRLKLCLLGTPVALFDIRAQSADIRVLPRQRFYMAMEGREHPFAPVVFTHIHALYPPKPAISPVTPLTDHHDLANDLAIDLGSPVSALT